MEGPIMGYIGHYLNDFIHIQKLYTIHYFEYMKDYVYDGESHDFWEFVFVDSGIVLGIQKSSTINQ